MEKESKKPTMESVENEHQQSLIRIEMGNLMLKMMGETEWKDKLKEPIMKEVADNDNLFNITTLLNEMEDKKTAIINTVVANLNFAEAIALQEELNYLIKRQMVLSVDDVEKKSKENE